MKLTRLLLVFVLLFLIYSCSTLLGISEPENITRESAYKYLYQNKIDTSNVIFLKPNAIETLQHRPYKPEWDAGFRPVQFKIFDKEGNLVFQHSTCEGTLKHTLIFEKFPPYNITPIDTTYTLEKEQLLIEDKIMNPVCSDYIAIIYWATYTGIIGRRYLKKVNKILIKQDADIFIYKLNTDFVRDR
ncbi:MAG: hypothetical protein ACOX0V_05825 [Bacteroidales bacterium]|jgi:hypothetical protein